MSNVIIFPEKLSASVFGSEVSGKTPTELYVAVMVKILAKYPHIIGQKETHFTTDSARAGQYTGTTRNIDITGRTVYIKTGLSTKDKWKGIEKTCQLAGITFEVTEGTGKFDWSKLDRMIREAVERSFQEDAEKFMEDSPMAEDLSAEIPPVPNINSASELPHKSVNEVKESVQKAVSRNYVNKTISNYNEPLITDTEESKFTFHSEFYHYEETYFSGRDWRKMTQEVSYFNGCFYFQTPERSDIIFKIYPNKQIKAICLKESISETKIAVNNNGIFILKDKTFILFSEEGAIKSKLKLKNSFCIDAVYIYDSSIYIADDKGRIHLYDIYGTSDIVIWDFSKERKIIEQAVAEDTLTFTGEKIKPKIDMRNTLRVLSLCANDKNIIAGFRFDAEGKYRNYLYEVFICINPVTYSWKVLQAHNRNDKSARIFTLDMRHNLIWWFRENKEGDRYLYSTEIKCIDDNIRNNTRFSYKIPSCISLEPYIYFDGKRAYAISHTSNYPHNGDISGFYFDSINSNGEFVQWNPSTAHGTSSDFLVLGNQIKTYHYGLFSSGTYNDPVVFQLLPDTYEEYKSSGKLIVTQSDIETALKNRF